MGASSPVYSAALDKVHSAKASCLNLVNPVVALLLYMSSIAWQLTVWNFIMVFIENALKYAINVKNIARTAKIVTAALKTFFLNSWALMCLFSQMMFEGSEASLNLGILLNKVS